MLLKLFVFCVLISTIHSWRRQAIQPKGFILANNHFGLNLLEQLSRENDKKPVKENIFFSPYSISMAFSMLHQGVNGVSSQQISTIFGYDLAKLPNKESISKEVRDSIDRLNAASENGSFVLKTANAMMQSKLFNVLPEYKESLMNNYDAELFELDFGEPEKALQIINSWAANKTNNKIDKLLQEPPEPNTKIALLNAVYFKGSWKLKFNANRTENGTFTDSKNNKYDNVEFMNIKAYFNVGYLSEIEANLIELPYEGDDLSLYAILPDDKQSDMEHIKKALNPWYIEAAIGRTYNNEVKIKFPKLSFKTDYGLVEVLKKMGVKEVFDKGDFSAMTNSSNLAVSQVKHAATIDINEEGSEASAATYITIVKLSLNLNTPTYEFDHPFLFFIRNNQNGNILFIGEVNQI